jgi:hypothetical protein
MVGQLIIHLLYFIICRRYSETASDQSHCQDAFDLLAGLVMRNSNDTSTVKAFGLFLDIASRYERSELNNAFYNASFASVRLG